MSEDSSHITLTTIADEHLAFITRYLSRLGVPAQDIEDVAQEVLTGAYRSLPKFDPARGSIRSWLMGIATNQASNHLRRAHRRREYLRPVEELEDLPDTRPDSEQRVMATDRRALLDRLLQEVPLERRSVFVAYELLELEMAEIAEANEIPISTAWSRHRLAWEDLDAAMRRWTARQRGRGHAMAPIGLAALVAEGRAAHDVPDDLLGRVRARAQRALESRALALAGAAGTATGSPVVVAALVGALGGAALAGGVALGLMRLWSTPTPVLAAASMRLAVPSVPTLATAAPLPVHQLGPAPSAPVTPTAPMAAAPGAVGTKAAVAATARVAAKAAAAPAGAAAPTVAVAHAAAASSATVAADDGATARPSEDEEIARERAIIQRAISALAAGQIAEAKRSLEEHAAAFPRGRLSAEREATRRALTESAVR